MKWYHLAGLSILILLAGCGASQANVVVAAKRWQRTIQVERWQLNHHEGWSIPAGGVETGSERRQHGTTRYACGSTTETYTSGGKIKTRSKTRYCEMPDYDTWYFYDLWEWTHIRDFVAYGDDAEDNRPRWPNADDIRDKDPNNPERLGLRLSVNQALLRELDTGTEHTIDLTDQLWRDTRVGQRLILVKDFFGRPTDLKLPAQPRAGGGY